MLHRDGDGALESKITDHLSRFDVGAAFQIRQDGPIRTNGCKRHLQPFCVSEGLQFDLWTQLLEHSAHTYIIYTSAPCMEMPLAAHTCYRKIIDYQINKLTSIIFVLLLLLRCLMRLPVWIKSTSNKTMTWDFQGFKWSHTLTLCWPVACSNLLSSALLLGESSSQVCWAVRKCLKEEWQRTSARGNTAFDWLTNSVTDCLGC